MEFRNQLLANVLGALLVVVLGTGAYCTYQYYHRTNLVGKFDVTAEKMEKDLEGRQVSISHGQVWPFDKNQGLSVSVVSKKQADGFVVVVVDVRASAVVEQPKPDPKPEPKPDPKAEAKKSPPPRAPTTVSVSGHLKLTYERAGAEWYLVGVDALNAKATAGFD